MVKKTKINSTYHPPRCNRFKTLGSLREGHFTWTMGLTVETENLYGVLDKVQDKLHWKPKNMKIKYQDITNEEIQELYDKARDLWRDLLGYGRKRLDVGVPPKSRCGE